jgi:hypothetical protein
MNNTSWIKITKNDQEVTMDISAREESIDADFDLSVKNYINSIVATYPEPYTIFATGGVDSQAVIQMWLKSGHKFNVVSVRYKDEFNKHDLETLSKFSKQFNIAVRYIDFDIINFLENQLEHYVLKYRCSSPQICAHMAFSELVPEGTVIFSGNIPSSSGLDFNTELLALYTYRDTTRPTLIPFFLMEDKDIAGACLRKCFEIVKPFSGSEHYENKCNLYNYLGLTVIPQEEKLTGFEKLKEYYQPKQHLVDRQLRLRCSGQPSQWVFDIFFRYRWYGIIGKPKYLKLIV